VSWQTAPVALEMMSNTDDERTPRVIKKTDIAMLERASGRK
jgi:hypothetical protein